MSVAPAAPDQLPRAADPGEAQLRRDAASGAMCLAAAEGRYGVTRIEYPTVYAWVDVAGERLDLRIDCADYPSQAPTSQPWDSEAATPLPVNLWPSGGQPPGVFRPEWSPGNGNAPYLACDRRGLAAHPAWRTAHPHRAWTAARTLTFYLDRLHCALVGAAMPARPTT